MIRLVINFEMHHYATHEQSSQHERPAMCLFISLQYVGNQIKRNVDDVNCDKMIDRTVEQLQDARN